MHTTKALNAWMAAGFISWLVVSAHAGTVYYALDNVVLDDHTQMTGTFSWTFDTNDFENGLGQFTSLDIPWTAHNQDDLDAVFDMGSSIEITLEGSVHDDGVDITLFLAQPLTATTSAPIDLARSKYEIGGNGFHDGAFLSGTISPVPVRLDMVTGPPGVTTLSWPTGIPGYVLQETTSFTNWTDAASGSTNPITVPATASATFYRLMKP